MKPILVHLDQGTFSLLDRHVPGRGRKRSKFIRQALLRALMEVVEEKTRRAYERNPPEDFPGWFDPEMWAPPEDAIRPGSAAARVLAKAVADKPAKQTKTKKRRVR